MLSQPYFKGNVYLCNFGTAQLFNSFVNLVMYTRQLTLRKFHFKRWLAFQDIAETNVSSQEITPLKDTVWEAYRCKASYYSYLFDNSWWLCTLPQYMYSKVKTFSQCIILFKTAVLPTTYVCIGIIFQSKYQTRTFKDQAAMKEPVKWERWWISSLFWRHFVRAALWVYEKINNLSKCLT